MLGKSFHSPLSKEEPEIACFPTHIVLGALHFVNLARFFSGGTPEISSWELVQSNGCGKIEDIQIKVNAI